MQYDIYVGKPVFFAVHVVYGLQNIACWTAIIISGRVYPYLKKRRLYIYIYKYISCNPLIRRYIIRRRLYKLMYSDVNSTDGPEAGPRGGRTRKSNANWMLNSSGGGVFRRFQTAICVRLSCFVIKYIYIIFLYIGTHCVNCMNSFKSLGEITYFSPAAKTASPTVHTHHGADR